MGAVQLSVLEGPGNAPKLQTENMYSSTARCSLPTRTKVSSTLRDTKRSQARWADMLCSSDDEDTRVSHGWSVGSGSSRSSSDTTSPGSTLSGASAVGTPESTAALEQDDDGCSDSGSEQVDLDWQEKTSLCEDVATLPDAMARSSETSDDSHSNEMQGNDLELIHAPLCEESDPCPTPEPGNVDQLDEDAFRNKEVTMGVKTARNQRKKARRVAAKKLCAEACIMRRTRDCQLTPVVRASLQTNQHNSLNRRLLGEIRSEVLELVVGLAGRQMKLLLGIGSFFLSQALRHPQLAACAALYSSMAH